MIRPNPNINQMMIFSPYLIHGCSSNDNINMTRFSLEIRFIKNTLSANQEKEFNEYLSKRNWR
jgi:ectoine hydroxylase-related dioxygenase (phytanoyl-CoA dioxygenase family)